MYIFVPGSTFNLTAIDRRISSTGVKLGRGVDELSPLWPLQARKASASATPRTLPSRDCNGGQYANHQLSWLGDSPAGA